MYAGWSAEAKRIGVPLTLVILPRSDSKDRSPRLLRYIHSLADRHGLDYLDVSEAFDALEVDEFRISDWDQHPNARGHRAIFEAIRDALSEAGLSRAFPRAPASSPIPSRGLDPGWTSNPGGERNRDRTLSALRHRRPPTLPLICKSNHPRIYRK